MNKIIVVCGIITTAMRLDVIAVLLTKTRSSREHGLTLISCYTLHYGKTMSRTCITLFHSKIKTINLFRFEVPPSRF